VLATVNATQAQQQWGTIKGQVIFGGNKPPAPIVLTVDNNKKECLDDQKKQQLVSEDWVIDPKTKGLKWALVYLIPHDVKEKEDVVKPTPIHAALKQEKPKTLVVDQPCCLFDPYVIALRDGQSITVKNSMPISHNCKVEGDPRAKNPAVNPA